MKSIPENQTIENQRVFLKKSSEKATLGLLNPNVQSEYGLPQDNTLAVYKIFVKIKKRIKRPI